MTTSIQSIDSSTSALLVGGQESFQMYPGGIRVQAVNDGPMAGFRSPLMNGDFNVWQRGSAPSYIVNSATNQAAFLADRWLYQIYSGSSGSGTSTILCSQGTFTPGQTDVPGEPRYFARFQPTAVGTVGGTEAMIRVSQRIEDVRTFAGSTVTVSFYAKADTTRTFAVILRQGFGSGGSATVATGQTFNVTASWQLFTLTFNVPSIAGKTIGTGDGLDLAFILYKNDNTQFGDALGPIGTWATQYLDLACVRLEQGSIASTWPELRPLGLELSLCKRYYRQSGPNGVGVAATSTVADLHFPFDTEMRAVPSIEVLDSAPSLRVAGSTSSIAGTWSSLSASPKGVLMQFSRTSGTWTAGNTVMLNDSASVLAFTAEIF